MTQYYQELAFQQAEKLRAWLTDPGSFMRRLQQHGIVDAQIRVLRQRWQFPTREEKKLLELPWYSPVLIREVVIFSHDKSWMFARSVFPRATLTGTEKKLAQLKQRSLGSILFNDPGFIRSAFEFTCLSPDTKEYKHIAKQINLYAKSLWARRSIFTRGDKSLLLTEVFLPDIETL